MMDVNTFSTDDNFLNPEAASAENQISEVMDEMIADATIANRRPQPARVRPMQLRRFLLGLVLSSLGIGTMLVVAVGAFRGIGIDGRLSLPVVAVCMIVGLMLLGGGFGIMATSAPTFDDGEFDRLVRTPVVEETTNSDADVRPAVARIDDAFTPRDNQRSTADLPLRNEGAGRLI